MTFVPAKRFVLFALVWLILTGGDIGGMAFGMPAAAAATWASLALLPPGRRGASLAKLVGLFPGFFRSSLLGGIDVAGRALHPRMPLDAGWITYPTKLPKGLARVSFGSETSLLPGSLVAGGRGDVLYIHCLDRAQDVEGILRKEEQRIAAMLSAGETPGPGGA